MFFAILTLISAILISATAAFFSISGLTALFNATAIGVLIMGIVLESGKVVAATWLHHNWKDPKISWLHKGYLCGAVGALMLITSLGIYGYLSKGYLEQTAPSAGIDLQVGQGDLKIKQLQDDNARLTTRLNQLDQSINVFLSKDKASQGLKARNSQKAERAEINKAMDENNAKIQQVQTEMLPLKTKNLEVTAKLGPVKYFAKAVGLKDDQAVNLVIALIMSAFDPLAIALVISGAYSLNKALEEKKLGKIKDQVEDLEAHISQEVKDLKKEAETDRAQAAEHQAQVQSEAQAWRESMDRDRQHLNHKSETLQNRVVELDDRQRELETLNEALQGVKDTLTNKQQELDAREQELASWEPIIEDAKKSEKERILAMLEANPKIIEDIIEIVDEAKSPGESNE